MFSISQPATAGVSTAATRTGWVLTGLFTLFMVPDVGIKLLNLPFVDETMAQLGFSAGVGFRIGILEAILLALYLVPRTAVLGAVLLTGLFGGTAATHLHAGSPLATHVFFGIYLALFAWGGLWLRNPALRALLPIRRP
jgi:hypothetical protein